MGMRHELVVLVDGIVHGTVTVAFSLNDSHH